VTSLTVRLCPCRAGLFAGAGKGVLRAGSRCPAGISGGPRTKSSASTGHRLNSSASRSSSSIDQKPSPSVTAALRALCVLPEPGPPGLPVLPVPLGPFAVDLSGAGRLGDVIQAGGTAPPAVRAAFGEPLLSEHPQRDETAEGDSRAARATSAPRASAWSSTYSPAIKTGHAVPRLRTRLQDM
jgi:hypothetical protein